MPPTDLPRVDWRVCCQALEGDWLGWRVTVHCRSLKPDQEPGPWRLVREAEYKIQKTGQVRSDYWKDLVRAAAR